MVLLIAFTAAIYLRTVARDVLAGDPGEFHFAAWRLGLAHPTGYPLYLLAGNLWQKLLAVLGLNPALALNAFSAVIGALGLGLLYRLMQQWLLSPAISAPADRAAADRAAADRAAVPVVDDAARGLQRGVGVFTALLFGWNLTYWSQNLIAEVYTLHVLFLLGIFGTAYGLGVGCAPGHVAGRRLILLSALIGLSLTHHGMTLLVLPALAVYLFIFHPRWVRHSIGVWLGIIAAGLAPLLLYLYIPLRGGPQASPWYHQQLGDSVLTLYAGDQTAFWNFITGQSISVGFNSLGQALGQLGFAFWLLRYHFTLAGLVLMGLGLFLLVRDRRYALLTLTGGYALTQLIFNLFYNIEDILVYYIPVYLMGAIWVGFGAHGLVTAAWRRRPASANNASSATGSTDPHSTDSGSTNTGSPAPDSPGHAPPAKSSSGLQWSNRLGWVVMAVLFMLPVSLVLNNLELVDQTHATRARDQWEEILAAGPEPDAILISNDRDEIVPLFYVQWVEARRQDLTGIFPLIAPDARFQDIATTVQTALDAAQTGVYLIKPMPGLEARFRLTPVTPPLVRVDGVHTPVLPGAQSGTLGPLQLLGYTWTSYDSAQIESAPNNDSSAESETAPPSGELRLYWEPQSPIPGDYTATVQIFDASGARLAQRDAPSGGVFYPTSLWKPGELLADVHPLHIPLGSAPHSLLIGFYRTTPDGEIEHLAPPLELAWEPSSADE